MSALNTAVGLTLGDSLSPPSKGFSQPTWGSPLDTESLLPLVTFDTFVADLGSLAVPFGPSAGEVDPVALMDLKKPFEELAAVAVAVEEAKKNGGNSMIRKLKESKLAKIWGSSAAAPAPANAGMVSPATPLFRGFFFFFGFSIFFFSFFLFFGRSGDR